MRIYRKNWAWSLDFGYSSSINDLDETLGCELLPLSHVRSIEGEALRFCHVEREEEPSSNFVRLNVNRHLRFTDGSSNPSHYKSSDEWPRLIRLIK